MLETATVRFTKDRSLKLKDVDEKANLLDCSRNTLMQDGIEMVTNFDLHFMEHAQRYASNLNIPVWLFIQNIVIKWMAEDAVRYESGHTERSLLEFMFTSQGPVTGELLYEQMKSLAIQELQEMQRQVEREEV